MSTISVRAVISTHDSFVNYIRYLKKLSPGRKIISQINFSQGVDWTEMMLDCNVKNVKRWIFGMDTWTSDQTLGKILVRIKHGEDIIFKGCLPHPGSEIPADGKIRLLMVPSLQEDRAIIEEKNGELAAKFRAVVRVEDRVVSYNGDILFEGDERGDYNDEIYVTNSLMRAFLDHRTVYGYRGTLPFFNTAIREMDVTRFMINEQDLFKEEKTLKTRGKMDQELLQSLLTQVENVDMDEIVARASLPPQLVLPPSRMTPPQEAIPLSRMTPPQEAIPPSRMTPPRPSEASLPPSLKLPTVVPSTMLPPPIPVTESSPFQQAPLTSLASGGFRPLERPLPRAVAERGVFSMPVQRQSLTSPLGQVGREAVRSTGIPLRRALSEANLPMGTPAQFVVEDKSASLAGAIIDQAENQPLDPSKAAQEMDGMIDQLADLIDASSENVTKALKDVSISKRSSPVSTQLDSFSREATGGAMTHLGDDLKDIDVLGRLGIRTNPDEVSVESIVEEASSIASSPASSLSESLGSSMGDSGPKGLGDAPTVLASLAATALGAIGMTRLAESIRAGSGMPSGTQYFDTGENNPLAESLPAPIEAPGFMGSLRNAMNVVPAAAHMAGDVLLANPEIAATVVNAVVQTTLPSLSVNPFSY